MLENNQYGHEEITHLRLGGPPPGPAIISHSRRNEKFKKEIATRNGKRKGRVEELRITKKSRSLSYQVVANVKYEEERRGLVTEGCPDLRLGDENSLQPNYSD